MLIHFENAERTFNYSTHINFAEEFSLFFKITFTYIYLTFTYIISTRILQN